VKRIKRHQKSVSKSAELGLGSAHALDPRISGILERLQDAGFLAGPEKPEIVAILQMPVQFSRRGDGKRVELKAGTYLTLRMREEVLGHYGEDFFPLKPGQYLISN
jgi:hypothetical protein